MLKHANRRIVDADLRRHRRITTKKARHEAFDWGRMRENPDRGGGVAGFSGGE